MNPTKLKPLIITMTVYNVTRICMPFVITVPYQTLFIILEEIKRVFVAGWPSSRAEINMRGGLRLLHTVIG